MPRRRPWFSFDLYTAREHLRMWLATLLARDSRGADDDAKARKARPELFPLEWRNGPSESIFGTMLPLALTAATAAEAVQFAGMAEAAEKARPGPLPDDLAHRSRDFDTPVGGGGGGAELPPGRAPARGGGEGDWGARRSVLDLDDDFGGSGMFWYAGGTAGEPDFGRGGGGGGDAGSGGRFSRPGDGDSSGKGGSAFGDDGLLSALPSVGKGNSKGSTGQPQLFDDPQGGGGGGGGDGGSSQEPDSSGLPTLLGELAGGPVRFVANDGQWDHAVDFATKGNGYQAWFTPDAAVIGLARDAREGESQGSPYVYDVLRLDWQGNHDEVRGAGEDKLSTVSNFLLGNDPNQWHTSVPEFGSVRYSDAWDGIDLVYKRADAGGLQYDLVVDPGALVSQISFRVDGADVAVENGQLILTTDSGNEAATSTPVVYQFRDDGTRADVSGSYEIRQDGTVGFKVGAYDPQRQLVIDPALAYTATLSGSSTESAYAVTADDDGNAVVAGDTASNNFPTTGGVYDPSLGGSQDAFAAKYDSAGNLVWSTYLGGTVTASETAFGVALTPDGSVVLTGRTLATDFPTASAYDATANGGYDAFLSVLAGGGSSLLYSSYFGGSGDDEAFGVAVDRANGQMVLAGTTTSSNLPTANAYSSSLGGSRDAFVTRFASSGSSLVFSTYLGGTTLGLTGDKALGVAIDAAGRAFVVGETGSTDFPVTNAYDTSRGGSQDAFVSEFDAVGGLVASTYLGGSSSDSAGAVAVDRLDRVYVTGYTQSSDFPTVNPVQGSTGGGGQDAFLTRFSELSRAPDYSTYLGGSGSDKGTGVAVDRDGRPTVVGFTASTNFPTQSPTQGTYGGGSNDFFVTRYEADGSALNFSTYWGTNAAETGLAAAVDRDGNMFAAGQTAGTDAVLVKYGRPNAPTITGMTDDTGASNSDRVTYDTTPTVFGTATASSTVTVYRKGVNDPAPVSAGTTTASAGGLWTFTYSALAGGVYGFSATATVSGSTSVPSAALTATIDTVAPALTLAVVSQTYDVTPNVVVTASDLIGFASPTTVTLDVDLDNDGNFTDPGETGYASAALTNGVAQFDGYTAITPNTTVRFRARVTDLAGNEGTSSTKTTQVQTSPVTWTVTNATPSTRSGYGVPAGDASGGLVYAGNLSTRHDLDLDVSAFACDCQDPYLVYHSQEANPQPTVQALLQSDSALGIPSHVYGTLTWDGTPGTIIDYNLSALSPGGLWVFGAAPTSSLATGRHIYTLALFVDYTGSANDHLVTVTGDTFVANRSASPYGAGWSFSNTDTLVSVAASGSYPAGVLRLSGKGGWTFYQDTGSGNYTEPPGDAGTMSFTGGVGWTYTSPSGRVSKFNTSGQMTSWTHIASHETLTYTYDASGGVATMTGPDGGVATFAYSGGLLQTITAPGSRVTTISYTGTDLTRIDDPTPGGGVHTLAYSSHRATGETQGVARRAYTYSNGLAATTQLGTDSAATVTPAIAAGLTAGAESASSGVGGTLVDGVGGTTKAWFNTFGQPVRTLDAVGGVRQYTRDANGFVTKYVDALDRETTFAVDSAGRVLGQTNPDATSASWVYGGAYGSLTKYTDAKGGIWTVTNDADGNPLTVKNPLGQTTTYTYDTGLLKTVTDALGNVTTLLYDAQRRPTGALLGGAVTGTTGYDAYGNANTSTDALGHVTTTTYDGAGHVTAVTDALGKTTTYTYSSTGVLLSTTDALNRVTSYAYDAAGRVEAVIDAYGTGSARRTTSVFDAAGRTIATVDGLANRSTTVYDLAGRVVATVDPLGNRTSFGYDLEGRQVSVRDALGRASTTAYDEMGRAVSATDPTGNVTTTVYDANSNVVARVDALGHRSTTVYDALDRVIASVDALGNRTTTGYDAAGRQETTTDALNHVTTTVYDSRNRVSATVDALNKRTTFGYDVADNRITVTDALNHVTTTVYDELNRAVASVDALANRATTVYDAAGSVSATVDALGNRTTAVYDDLGRQVATVNALNQRSTTVYDAADRVVATIDGLGNRTTSVYDNASRMVASVDALSNRTTSVYDAAGQMIATVDALGNRSTIGYDAVGRQATRTDALSHTWTTAYDAAGRSVSSTDPNGHTMTTVYDDADRVIASVDTLGNRTSYGYDAASNRVTVTNPRGHVTTSVYDELNRVAATVDPLDHRVTSVYDDAGRSIATVDALTHRTTTGYDNANRAVTTTDALGKVWTTAYDAADNAVSRTDPLGHTTTTVYDALNRAYASVDALGNRTTSTFDAAGNLQTLKDARGNVTTFAYDARNLGVTTTDALSNVWTTQYDARGHAWRMIDPVGRDGRTYFDDAGRVAETADGLGYRSQTAYDAAGNRTAMVDPLGHRTTYGYDTADRLVTEKDALSGVTTFAYDGAGNRVSLKDPVGNTTTWVYDAANRVTTETDPTNTSKTYAYDAADRLTSVTDRIGRRRDFGYDDVNRKSTEKWYAVGGALSQTQTWTYDAAGRLSTAQDPDGTYTMGYDNADRVTSVAEPFGLLLTFGYDEVGNRTVVQDSKSGVTTVGFDALNRQSSEELGGSGITKTKELRSYTAAGELSLETRQSWSGSAWTTVGTTSYAYDADGRMTRLTHFTSGGGVLASYVYAYDAADRLTSEVLNGTTRTYTYDNTDQLTADAGTAYGYDANGNRNTSGYATGSANRMTTDGVWTYTYDAEGNVTKRSKGAASDTWVYGYDNRNQMTTAAFSATDGGSVTKRVTYAYDAWGSKIQRQAWDGSTTTERYGQDGWDPAKPSPVGTENFDIWADLDGSNNLSVRRNYGPGFDEMASRQSSGGTVGWYLTDRLGSVRGVTDGSGTPLTTITYSGWGTALSNSTLAQSDRYLYTAREWDTVLELREHRARFTNGTTWFGEDPKGFAASDTSLYRYVRNHPTLATDPSGLRQPQKDTTIAGLPPPTPTTITIPDNVYDAIIGAFTNSMYTTPSNGLIGLVGAATGPTGHGIFTGVALSAVSQENGGSIFAPAQFKPPAVAASLVGAGVSIGGSGLINGIATMTFTLEQGGLQSPTGVASLATLSTTPGGLGIVNGLSLGAMAPPLSPLVVAPGKPGTASIFPQANRPQPDPGQTWWGMYHTHPYAANEGGFGGMTFSGADIAFYHRNKATLPYYIVISRTCIYALTDGTKRVFVSEGIRTAWEKLYNAHPGNFDVAAEAATIAIARDLGLNYYKACAGADGKIPKVLTLVR